MSFGKLFVITIVATISLAACNHHGEQKQNRADSTAGSGHSYMEDAAFLESHGSGLIELKSQDGKAKVLLSAQYQGRVMTSTATGDSGISYGWINYSLISSGQKKKQFNAIGGENRFWIGPEGGQYSIYFKAPDSFTIAHWQVPPIIDTVSYDVSQSGKTEAVFTKKASLTNYSGTNFDITIERKISLLDKNEVSKKLQSEIPTDLSFVGYEASNSITNSGNNSWKKEKGLLSIWLLGMFAPTPQTLVIIPFHPLPNSSSLITDDYFGKIPRNRLQVNDSVLFFTCDGKYRSKIGLSPKIAKPLAASFDFKNNVLTLIIPSIEKDGMYVNSKWQIQDEPYKGDVINSYNDGPLQDGSQLGPFYEVESSSSTRELKHGEKLEYSEITCHLQGNYNSLRQFVLKLLNADLDEIKKNMQSKK